MHPFIVFLDVHSKWRLINKKYEQLEHKTLMYGSRIDLCSDSVFIYI